MGFVKRSGIYKIQCTVDGFCYIGGTKKFSKRFSEHSRRLSKGIHRNKPMQDAHNIHGADAFTYEIVLICTERDLLFYEQLLLDNTRLKYNVCPNAGNSKGFKFSEESRQAMSLARRGDKGYFYGKHHTDETRARMQELTRKRWKEMTHPMSGKPWPGDRIRQSEVIKRAHAEGRLTSWQKSRPFSEEQKAKQRQTIADNGGRAGKKNVNYKKHLTPLVEKVKALLASGMLLKDACREVGLSRITFYKRMKANNYES